MPPPPRPKHAALARPDVGEWSRHELAILGTPCADLQSLVARLAPILAPALRLGYVDADHAAADANPANALPPLRQAGVWVELTNKIHFRRRDEARPLTRFTQPELLTGADLVLVNGNHFRARQQIVVIDPRKPLAHKLDRLTDVQALLLADGETEIPAELRAHLPHCDQLPIFKIEDTAAITAWLQAWLAAARPPLRGLVLAGGQSQRMHTDKGRLHYQPGHEQRAVAAALLADVCQDVFVSCRAEQAADLPPGLVPLPDQFLDLGPLGGILSAFRHDPNAAWLVLACDLPFLSAATLRQLLAGRHPGRLATAFQSPESEFPEPLITVFEPRAYPELLRFLSLGYACPRKMLINSDIALLPSPAGQELRNVNTPEQREAALRELAG